MSMMMMASEQAQTMEANRIIYMGGDFNEMKAEMVVARMLHFDSTNPSKDILLMIDSYGGMIDSFVSIHDTMQLLRCDVATCCVGKAMSCGQMLLVSGAKGKRFITPNSRVMIHELSAGNFGKLSDIEISFKENQRVQKDVLDKLNMKYTNLNKKQLVEMRGKDTFLSATECLSSGMVDHIATDSSILYKNINI